MLLLNVPGVVLPLEALELVEGRVGGLAEQDGHALGLLGLGEQHGVAAQDHRLVLHLVPVDPGEDLGVAAVGHAVGDAVQQVGVAGAAGALLGCARDPSLLPPPPPPTQVLEHVGTRAAGNPFFPSRRSEAGVWGQVGAGGHLKKLTQPPPGGPRCCQRGTRLGIGVLLREGSLSPTPVAGKKPESFVLLTWGPLSGKKPCPAEHPGPCEKW
uniref:Uncharacterized protein n=1 Tax=Salvator merianae TaxID=96440 RepID=A0A8D0BMA5_SALMN